MGTEATCPVCKGEMVSGRTDITFRRDRSIVVVEGVPALVCQHCGEASLDSETAKAAYALAEREISRGVTLEFCTFAA